MYLDGLAGELQALAPQLSQSRLERAGICILDALACAYGGRQMPWVAQARAVAGAGGAGEVTVWASGGVRRGLADAIYANAVGCHSLLAEDTHAASRVHPGTVAVPVALGVGELVGASGDDVLRAVILGYEAMAQLATTTLTDDFVDRGWRATSVFGPFGAVAAAAHLYGMDARVTADALALAASSAGGLCEWARAGTTEVYFQPAAAARAGVVAVLLAQAGLRGAASAVEGPFGIRRAFGGADMPVPQPVIDPAALAIESSFFKAHAACAFTQAAIDAAVRVHGSGVDPGDVRDVEIHTSTAAASYPGCDNADSFQHPISRQMSLQFGVAAALLDGRLEPRHYEGAVDATLAELAARARVVVESEYDRGLPARLDARVEVAWAGGRRAVATSGDRVDLPPAGVIEKFRRYAGPALGPDVSEQMIRLLGPGEPWTAADLAGRLQ